MANDFVDFPLRKLTNRENIFSRLDRLEGRTGARPSARVDQLGQMGDRTGNLIVDGDIVVMNRDTGQEAVTIDEDGIVIVNEGTSDPFITFKDAAGAILGRILTSVFGNLEISARGAAANNEERKLILRSQLDNGLVNIATIEVIANLDDTDVDVITLNSDYIYLISDGTGIGGAPDAGYMLTVTGQTNLVNILAAFLFTSTIPASTTYYGYPYYDTLTTSPSNLVLPVGGVLRNMSIKTGGAQPASGSLVATLYVNGVASALTVTVAAGGAAQIVTDSTHTVTVSAGDQIRWVVQNNATATSATINSLSMVLEVSV